MNDPPLPAVNKFILVIFYNLLSNIPIRIFGPPSIQKLRFFFLFLEFWELVFTIFLLLKSWGIRVSCTLSDSSDAMFTDIPLMLPLNLPPPVALTLFCFTSPQSTCSFWRCFCLLSVAGPPAKIQAFREQGHTRASVYSLLCGSWREWWLTYGR